MSYSSNKKHKLIFENWRRFLREEITTEDEAAQWLADKIAPLVQQADAGNYTEPLRKLVSNLNSADGMSPMVRQLLSKGDADNDPQDEVIQVKMNAMIPANQLRPTQGVIDLFKSVGYNGSNAGALKSVIGGVSGAPPILAAGSGGQYFIVDGHHRWSGATVYNTECKIPANVIIMDPGKALLISQLTIAAYLGAKKIPSAGAKKGRSIIGPSAMDREQVEKTLLGNIGQVMDKNAGGVFMNPKVIAVIMNSGYGQGEELQELATPGGKLGKRKERIVRGAISKIAANCEVLANKYSDAGPDREIMPQFDPDKGGPKFKSVASDIAKGKINYKPEFK